MKFTKVFYDILKAVEQDKKLIVLYGGSSSSKTISVLQYLLLYALKYENKRITISSESLPVFPNGSIFQFVPADDEARWHGLRSHITLFDELYYIKEGIFQQAAIRTNERVFATFNPVSKFYVVDYWEDDSAAILHSTYLDNPFLSDTIITALTERISKDENFRRVYLEGKFGSVEGLVYTEGTDWVLTDEFPEDYEDRMLGLDFGFTHPTALVDVRLKDGELWVREKLYKSKLTHKEIASYIDYRTIADSADPRGIAEIKKEGISIKNVKKGPDSVINGIRLVKQYKMNIHKDSINLINELRNYKWDEDKDGNTLEKPVKAFDDALDALRYAVDGMLNKKEVIFL